MSKVRDILGPDKESEFLQSFVRVGFTTEEDDDKALYIPSKPDTIKETPETKFDLSEKSPRRLRQSPLESARGNRGRRKTRDYFDEVYTDKDRAAAVSIGSYDIKQSLNMKRRQDRTQALQLPDEADPGALYALGQREFKSGNLDTAVMFISQALELNATDINALIARSKCYLLLGDPAKGLQDAETALATEKTNIRALYQKAEALYYLGQFEHSLMFFHRGLRLRPELNTFRLGVQKTQEAIEMTIGELPRKSAKPKCPTSAKISSAQSSATTMQTKKSLPTSNNVTTVNRPRSKISIEKREARKLLGDLCVDKEYLENLLKHPHLKRADTGSENISGPAQEAIAFLNNRQEFWRQQRPCTALPNKKQIAAMDGS